MSSNILQFRVYYWPKPGGNINYYISDVDDPLGEAFRWQAESRVDAAKIWCTEDEYHKIARGHFPRVIGLISYPKVPRTPKLSASEEERVEWEEAPGSLRASGARWHISSANEATS